MNANLFNDIPKTLDDELLTSLLKTNNVHIERIISQGHTTAVNQWYDQAWDEWILLVQGQARLRYEQDNQCIDLKVGDYLLIPANTRHRVEWTLPNNYTIWLAIHIN